VNPTPLTWPRCDTASVRSSTLRTPHCARRCA
jgi:hypothetical protein